MNALTSARLSLGVLLLAIGLGAVTGWLVRVPVVMQVVPGFTGMVINSALAVALMGVALLLPALPLKSGLRWRYGIGIGLMGLALLVLAGYPWPALRVLDLPHWHAWLQDGNPYPGRMAPNTAVAIFAFGLALTLLPRQASGIQRAGARRATAGFLMQGASFLVLAAGLTGLAGYSIRLDLLYPELQMVRMALPTAACLTLAGLALFLQWIADDAAAGDGLHDYNLRLRFLGAAILCTTTLTAGVAAFANHQKAMERNLAGSLSADFNNRKRLFDSLLAEAVQHAQRVADTVPLVAGAQDARRLERELAQLAPDVRAVRLIDDQGKTLLQLGEPAGTAQLTFDLASRLQSRLLWRDQLLLQTRVTRTAPGGVPRTVVVEHALPVLTAELFGTQGIGASGEIGICMGQGEQLLCLPQRRNPVVYRTSRLGAQGEEFPMSRAVKGRSGIFSGLDYRNRQVIAVYGPLHPGGLGMVLKQDTSELYQPIRRQLELTLPLLLLFVALGSIALHAGIKPLTDRLLASEQAAREAALRIRTVVENVGEGIITIDEEGRIESFNAAASAIFGYRPDEVIGRNIDVLIPAHLRAGHHAGMKRYLAGGAPAVVGRKSVQMTGLRRDGGEFCLELTVNVLRDVTVDGQAAHQARFVGIVRDVTERQQAQQTLEAAHARLETRVAERTAELSEANRQLQESEQRLRDLAAHRDRIKEEERKRIAREIHDELGGLLTGIKSYLSFSIDSAARSGCGAEKHLIDASVMADEAINTVRRVITDLRPSVLDHLGLWAALEWYAGQFQQRTGLPCRLQIAPAVLAQEFDPERSTAVFRIVQEALTNVVRHAEARAVAIDVTWEDHAAVIRLTDDGKGMPPREEHRSDAWGIAGMHERARYFGGTLAIHGNPGQGTELVLRMPLETLNA